MLLFKKVKDLQEYLRKERNKDNTIGFVPTMGALHNGHLSLFRRCQERTDISVASIFVNPTQFNEKEDLVKYPRTPGADIDQLTNVGCHVLFMPPVAEVYPDNAIQEPLNLDFGYLAEPMEGANRPGHFQGMAQVVHRLLEIVQPDGLFMGQKDYQQFAIVKNMLSQLDLPIDLRMCPIVREADGLAMSSRNRRLSTEQRRLAPNIYRTLMVAKEKVGQQTPEQVKKEAMKMLQIPGMDPEYFEIVDGVSLQEISTFDEAEIVVACTAIRVGEIRLIDNMVLKSNL